MNIIIESITPLDATNISVFSQKYLKVKHLFIHLKVLHPF